MKASNTLSLQSSIGLQVNMRYTIVYNIFTDKYIVMDNGSPVAHFPSKVEAQEHKEMLEKRGEQNV